MSRRLLRRAAPVAPVAVLLAVMAADLGIGSGRSVASLVVIAPLLASSLVGPAATSAVAAVAFAEWLVLALVDDQFTGGARSASVIRGVGVVVGCAIAIAAAIVRQRREERLVRVERVALATQRAILSPVPDALGPLQLAARYESAARDASVGGDFYDAAETRFGTRILLGDVRGKGLDAVRLSASVLGAFRERADETADLAELLGRLSDAVVRRAVPGDFVTAVLVQVDADGALTAVTAGHPPPVLVRDSCAGLLDVPVTRPPLGFSGRASAITHRLRPNDKIVLYTDGATEARRPGDQEFFDDQRLLTSSIGGDCRSTVATIFDELNRWTRRRFADDIAVLALDFVPERTDLSVRPVRR